MYIYIYIYTHIQGVVVYAPGEPLIHKWVWANKPFGGFSAPDFSIVYYKAI